MPGLHEMVINTGPILAIVAALGDLRVLRHGLRIWVPWEVGQEIAAGGSTGFGLEEFSSADWLEKASEPLCIAPHLLNTLDRGEAAVIQTALNQDIQTVIIDEAAGRCMARLNGLSVTGSIGILLRGCWWMMTAVGKPPLPL